MSHRERVERHPKSSDGCLMVGAIGVVFLGLFLHIGTVVFRVGRVLLGLGRGVGIFAGHALHFVQRRATGRTRQFVPSFAGHLQRGAGAAVATCCDFCSHKSLLTRLCLRGI